jgi:thioredoxin reductase (NADPH)
VTAILVPAILGGLAITVMALVAVANARKGAHPDRRHQKPALIPELHSSILVHAINDDRCVGCDACVAVCPTNVLDLINNKSRVLRFQDCIQCEQCMWVCPTDALVMYPEGGTPPPIEMPEISEHFETAVAGQYLIGEVAGKPLVKNAANLGRAVVEHMLAQGGLQPGSGGADVVDVAIVGSGPGGLSAALTCIRRGLSYVVLEKEQCIASTVSRYPKGKWVMAEPYDVRNVSFLPVFDSSKEQMVPIWEEVVQKSSMNIKRGEPVESVAKDADGKFTLRTTVAQYRAQRVVLGIGTRGKPRTLGVPGENLPKVMSLLEDPDNHRGQAVLVVGGGDSALEAAMALADSGARVVMSYRGKNFSRAQKKNQAAIESYESQKRIKVLLSSGVVQFTDDTVTIKLSDGQTKSYPNQAAFVLIGAEPPVEWLKKVGVNVVERPHSFTLGKTDDLVVRFAGADNVTDCPEQADAAVTLAREGRLPAAVQKQMEELAASKTMMFGQPLTGPKGWLKSAKTMFTQALRLDQPMTLGEFANRAQTMSGGPSRSGRRDGLSASERTRVLRMLRDEGGRLADEDTKMLRVGDVAPHLVPPPAQPEPTTQPGVPQPGTGQRNALPKISTVFAHGAPPVQRTTQSAPQPMPQAAPVPAPAPVSQNTGTIIARTAPPTQQRSQQHPQQHSQQYPQQAPQQHSQQYPQQASQQHSQQYPQQAPQQAPQQHSQQYPQQTPQQAPQQRSQQYPQQRSQQHPAQAQHAPMQPNANVIRRGAGGPGAFDEEPTRQVDGEAALDALLNGDPAQTSRLNTDLGVTQAVRYTDPLSAGVEEPTRIGHLSTHFGVGRSSHDYPADDLQEPTRAIDPLAAMRASDPHHNPQDAAPTRTIDLHQMGLHNQGEAESASRNARRPELAGAGAPQKRPPQGGRK